jgi:hypothetical protein
MRIRSLVFSYQNSFSVVHAHEAPVPVRTMRLFSWESRVSLGMSASPARSRQGWRPSSISRRPAAPSSSSSWGKMPSTLLLYTARLTSPSIRQRQPMAWRHAAACCENCSNTAMRRTEDQAKAMLRSRKYFFRLRKSELRLRLQINFT